MIRFDRLPLNDSLTVTFNNGRGVQVYSVPGITDQVRVYLFSNNNPKPSECVFLTADELAALLAEEALR